MQLDAEQRQLHTSICGTTGAGKSRLREAKIRQDILSWPDHERGLLLLDPHGAFLDGVAASRHPRHPRTARDLRSEWRRSAGG